MVDRAHACASIRGIHGVLRQVFFERGVLTNMLSNWTQKQNATGKQVSSLVS